jgi:hypothetical protein
MHLCVPWCGNLIHLSHSLKNLIRVAICLIYILLLQSIIFGIVVQPLPLIRRYPFYQHVGPPFIDFVVGS